MICCVCSSILCLVGILRCLGGKAKDAKRAAAKEKKAEKSGGLASMVRHPPKLEVATYMGIMNMWLHGWN